MAGGRAAVEAAIARADAPDAASVFTLRLDREARLAADAADLVRASGDDSPFLGMPITVKDNFDLAGHATTAGSILLADAPPANRDAPVVERLKHAGCAILGRTNMTEFAFSGLGLNPHYGTPSNPAFPGERRLPGGSSSGAAVSVGLGIAAAAIGTDTGGSVRIPAALCGLTGFKPTASTVSGAGVLPLSWTLDAVGVVARTVADCAGLFDVIRDAPGVARHPLRPDRVRMGLLRNYVLDGVTNEVESAFAAALRAIADAGVSLVPLEIDAVSDIPKAMASATLPATEAAAWHAPFLAAGRDAEYDPRVILRIRAGEGMRAPDYVKLVQWRRVLIGAVAAAMDGLDALAWPTVPFTAPTIDSLAEDGAYHAANGLILRNPTVVNLFDGCAISLPCPGDGPPVGFMLAALGGQDDHLLRCAALIQSIIGGDRHDGD